MIDSGARRETKRRSGSCVTLQWRRNPVRVFVLATMLLASSSLGSLAQEQGKALPAAPQAGTSVQTDQNAAPQPDQRTGRDQPKTHDHEVGEGPKTRRDDGERMGRDTREMGHSGMMRRGDTDRLGGNDREMGGGGMMRRSDGDRMNRDEREKSQDSRMYRDRETSRDREPDRGRYSDRGDRDWDRADRDRDNRGYVDADQPRRRVKVCFEFENGDE